MKLFLHPGHSYPYGTGRLLGYDKFQGQRIGYPWLVTDSHGVDLFLGSYTEAKKIANSGCGGRSLGELFHLFPDAGPLVLSNSDCRFVLPEEAARLITEDARARAEVFANEPEQFEFHTAGA